MAKPTNVLVREALDRARLREVLDATKEAFAPLTAEDIAAGRMRYFEIVIRPCDYDGAMSVNVGAVSAARALRVLADRLENPAWKGPAFTKSPELTYSSND